jgi:hypothetical protein
MRGCIALFMAGRSVSGTFNGPEFIGYFGIQVLLSDYGGALEREDVWPEFLCETRFTFVRSCRYLTGMLSMTKMFWQKCLVVIKVPRVSHE